MHISHAEINLIVTAQICSLDLLMQAQILALISTLISQPLSKVIGTVPRGTTCITLHHLVW